MRTPITCQPCSPAAALATPREQPAMSLPVLLPRPIPRTPLLILMPVARNAERSVQRGAPAWRGGPTGWSKVSHASTRVGAPSPTPLSRLPLSPECHHRQIRHQIAHMGRGKRHSAAFVDREHFPCVHCLASCNHWRSPGEVLCSAHIALCSNNMLSHDK